MPPEHDHAMLWLPMRGSNPPLVRSRPFPPFAVPAVPAISRGRPAISVGFGPVSDPDPTVIGGEHDLGQIGSARSGPRRRAPTFGYARTRHRRVGEDPP